MTTEQQELPKLKYPNSFLFGFACGGTVQATSRYFLMESLSARPLAYIKTGLCFGAVIFYWDYFRRNALERVMEREDQLRYYQTMQSINHNMRVGDEDEISNLTEYLAGSTTRAWNQDRYVTDPYCWVKWQLLNQLKILTAPFI